MICEIVDSDIISKRSYNQCCGVARALDVVGERWTLLLGRELSTGTKRYKNLLEGLFGIGTNLLAARLKDLEAQGLVCRTTLPPNRPSNAHYQRVALVGGPGLLRFAGDQAP